MCDFPYPISDQTLKNGKNLLPISDKQAKNTQFQAKMSKIHTRFQTGITRKLYCLGQHTYIAYIREYLREVVLLSHSHSNREDDKVYLVFVFINLISLFSLIARITCNQQQW